MSATVFGKWYWSDWMSDPGVRASSYAARGLWMDLLCIAATADPTGYVVLNGRPLIASDIARLTGGDASEVEILLDELARNGVFTRDRHGRIYSRRMVREAKNAKTNRENGRRGGNPSLGNTRQKSDPVNPPVKGGDKPQKPEARNQKPDADASARARGLRSEIAKAFSELAPQRLVPDTNRAAVWLASGHEPEIVLAVIREILARKPDVGSLSYFDRPIEEATARKKRGSTAADAPSGPLEQPRPVMSPEAYRRVQIRMAAEHFRGHFNGGWPNEMRPGHPDCTLSDDVIQEAQLLVAAERGCSVSELPATAH